MIFKTVMIHPPFLKSRERKSRRDNTLLTVDFNLRKRNDIYAQQSPAGTTLCKRTQVSSLRDLAGCVVPLFRRLKPTVNKVPSLRDYSLLSTIPLVVNFSFLKDNPKKHQQEIEKLSKFLINI